MCESNNQHSCIKKLVTDNENEYEESNDELASICDNIQSCKLAEIIKDPKSGGFDNVVILDARYDYEYAAGRIVGAINVRELDGVKTIFEKYANKNVCVVVHCEYSCVRGPKLFNLFREYDMSINKLGQLCFPNLCLLKGGYRKFHEEFPALCVGRYVSMMDEICMKGSTLEKDKCRLPK